MGKKITDMDPSGGSGIATEDGYAVTAGTLPAGLAIDADSGKITGTPTTHTAGAASVTVTVTDAAGNPATVAIDFPAVGKGTQDLSGFAYSSTSLTFGDPAPTPTAPTVLDNAGLSYASGDTAVCTVDTATGALTIAGAGDCTVTLTAAATTNYAETTAEVTVTVNKADQDLSGFAYSPTNLILGATPPALVPPAVRDGAALTYAVSDTSVCTVDTATGALTIAGAGDCTVTLTTAATANYNAATAGFTVTVYPKGTTLVVDPVTGDDVINIAEKAAGFAVTGLAVADATVSLTLDAKPIPALSAKAGADGRWSVSVPSAADYITDSTLELKAVTGDTTLTRTLTVDLDAPTAPTYSAPTALTVGKKITDMDPSGGSGIATEDGYAVTAGTLPAGLAIDADSGKITGTPTTHTAGAASVTVTVTDAAGNPATVAIDFPAVGKGTQDLSGFAYSSTSLTFGDPAPTPTAPTVLDNAGLSYASGDTAVCTVDTATGALTIKEAGTCAITVTAAATANYAETTATVNVTVNPAGTLSLAVAAVTGDNTLNIAEKTAGFTVEGTTGSVNGVTVAVTLGTTELRATSADHDHDDDSLTNDEPGHWSVSVPANASYVSGTSLALRVSAAKTGYDAPSDVTRTLTVDLAAPTAPTYSAPTALTVGKKITDMDPSGGSGIATEDGYAVTAGTLPAGLAIDADSGKITGTPTTHTAGAASVTVTVTDAAGNPATVAIDFPAVGEGQIILMIYDREFKIDILHLPLGASLTARQLPRDGMASPENVTFTTPPVYLDGSILNADEHIGFCLPHWSSLNGYTGALYTAGENDGSMAEHWIMLDDQVDDQNNERVCARASSFSPHRVGYTPDRENLDNATGYRLSVHDVSDREDVGTMVFSVSLNTPSTETVTVEYATQQGTAKPGFDYTATSGTLSFDAGETEKQVKVEIWDDDVAEPDKSFTLVLSNPVNAELEKAVATGTIIDDDTPILSIFHATADEGAGEMRFKVELAPWSDETVTVDYTTTDGSATAGDDYTRVHGTLTFEPGQTKKTLRVPLVDDAVDEADKETFDVKFSNLVNAEWGRRRTVTGWIYDNDVRGIRVIPETVQVDEGSSASFEVVLATQPIAAVTVVVSTDAAGLQLAPTRLRFDADNWDTAQTVAVTAPADEDMVDADRMLMLTGSGGDYVDVQARVVLSILDANRPQDSLPGENPMVAPVGMSGADNEMRQ